MSLAKAVTEAAGKMQKPGKPKRMTIEKADNGYMCSTQDEHYNDTHKHVAKSHHEVAKHVKSVFGGDSDKDGD